MKKYNTGIVIGRFQPFHLGHKFLIDEALKVCEQIIVGIGSSNIIDEKNPYSYKKREHILTTFIEKEGLSEKIIDVIPIVDHPDDQIWLEKILKQTASFDVAIGDNAWVNDIFEKAGITVVRVGFHKRDILEGKKIRRLIKAHEKWQDRVPEYLINIIAK